MRGHEAYRERPAVPGVRLDLDGALGLVLPLIMRELREVPEARRDEAIDEAAAGYLEAHREAAVGGAPT